MEPNKKKVSPSRRWDDSSKSSSLKKKYLVSCTRAAPNRAKGSLTMGRIHAVAKAFIMVKLRVQILEKSYWGKWSAFTQPTTQVEAI